MSKIGLVVLCVAAVFATALLNCQDRSVQKDEASCTFQSVDLYGEDRARNSTDTLLLVIGHAFQPVSATSVQLPAVYPLVNILLPLLNNVYNLLLSLLSIFDTLPANISCMIPVDLGALETSLLKLYSQALAIVNFLRSLPEYAVGANPNTPPANVVNLQGLLTTLISSVTDLTDDVLTGIGGALLPGLLQLVVMVVQALLSLLL